jgi:hypothetical protein
MGTGLVGRLRHAPRPEIPAQDLPTNDAADSRVRHSWRWLIRAGIMLLGVLAVLVAMWDVPGSPAAWYDTARQWVVGVAHRAWPPTASSPVTDVSAKALIGINASASSLPLPLLLVTTKPGRTSREGTASIGVSRENPQTYVAGALLSNGAQLTEVHTDYVVLERGGHSARLYLGQSTDGVEDAGARELLTVGGRPAQTTAVAASSEPLTDYIRPSPVYSGSTLRGYEVYPGERGAAFAHIGLQPGDIITAIDGIPLKHPEPLRGLLNGAASKVTVLRNGRRIDL